MKKKVAPRFPDYDKADIPEGTVTFGTTFYVRKDGLAMKVVLPCGNTVTFAPLDVENPPAK